jgi:hypothetical protein
LPPGRHPARASSQPDCDCCGVCRWSPRRGALIIALEREDVVLPGDIALRKVIQLAYQLGHLPAQQEVLAIAEKWRPYRSLATSYLFSATFQPAGTPPTAPAKRTDGQQEPPAAAQPSGRSAGAAEGHNAVHPQLLRHADSHHPSPVRQTLAAVGRPRG